jgi:hypothetical protein
VAFINAQNTRVLYGNVALSCYLRSVSPQASIDMLDITTLCDTSRQFTSSLRDFSLNLDGFLDDDGTAGSVVEALTAPIATGSTVPTSVAPNGFAAGQSVWLVPARTLSFEPTSQVADVVTFNMALGSGTPANTGVSLIDLAALTTTGNGTTIDQSAATSNGALAHLHVTAVDGSDLDLDVVVQHSTNGSDWSTLLSFTSVSTTTSEVVYSTGTVNRYVRATWTITGTDPSFTAQVSLARLS